MPNLDAIVANRYLISSGHYLAARAGFEILEAGGNAVDAGVASNLVLGVVQSDQVNIAGVAPMMIHLADRQQTLTIAGLGYWPKAADIEHFIDGHDGQVPVGLLRTVVPAAPDAHIVALERFGTMRFGEVVQAAIRCARDGFPMHGLMSDYIATYEERYRLWPQNKAIYLPDNRPPRPGERFVQTDLASSLQYMADEERAAGGSRNDGLAAARAAFYRGDIGQAIVRYHQDHGGWLTAADLDEYRSPVVPTVSRNYSGFGGQLEVMTCDAWCQGPILLEMLGLLEGFDLRSFGHNSPQYLHVMAECIKLAFADRERYFGDPEHVDVPLARLLSSDYLTERRRLVDRTKASPGLPLPGEVGSGSAGVPAGTIADSRAEVAIPGDTSYTCVVDGDGNVFSSNPSDVTWESPIIPGTGLCPSSRGSQSWAVRGHASCVAPGKRPRLTPNPVMFRRNGGPPMPIGTPGGDVQPQAVLQVLMNLHCFGMNAQEAIDQPRMVTYSQPDSFSPHAAYPGKLNIESTAGAQPAQALQALGHAVEVLDGPDYRTAGVCLIDVDDETGALWGGADRRRPAQALGW